MNASSKFSFLLPTNPYRAYYEHKVKEFKTGEVVESKPEVPQAIIDQKAKEDEKKKKNLGGQWTRARQALARKVLQRRVVLLENRVAELEKELRARAAAA